jgi:hypothetical protein
MKLILMSICLLLTAFSYSQWSLTGNANASNTTSKLGTTNAIHLRLFTNNIERVRLTTAGFLGIGTTNPLAKLHVNGTSSFGANVTATNSTRVLNLVDPNAVMRVLRVHATFAPAIELLSRTTPDGANVAYWDMYTEPSDASFRIRDRLVTNLDRLIISRAGNVGIGTSVPASKLHIVGSGHFDGSLSVLHEGGGAALGIRSVAIDENDGRDYATAMTVKGGSLGVYAVADGNGPGGGHGRAVYGDGSDIGVEGLGVRVGVYGHARDGYDGPWYGVEGFSAAGLGGFFHSTTNNGLEASSENADMYAAFFNGNIYSTGTFESSDRVLKDSITALADGMVLINQLKPSLYQFKRDPKLASLHLPSGSHFGLVAQEVELVLPNVVKETTKKLHSRESRMGPSSEHPELAASGKTKNETIKIKAVNYSELIPILIRGIQQMDSANKAKDERISILEEKLNEVLDRLGSEGIGSPSAWIKQNTPNPVRSSTSIQYFIPENIRAARILVTNAKGQQLKVYNVSGSGTVNFSAGTLPSGTYTYSLVADGKIISTKKLVIVR